MIPSDLGSVGALTLSLFHKWEPKRVFVLITAYLDESGTHGAQLMTVAGFAAKAGQWVDFEKKWRRLLKRNELTHCHARMLYQTKGQFKGWPFSRRASFVQEIAKIADRHTLFGFTVMLRKDEFEQYYRCNNTNSKAKLDSMYGLCVRGAISFIANSAAGLVGRDDLEISFVLEEGHRNAGGAVEVFNQIKQHGPPDLVRCLRTISFGSKAEFPGLQAADINAYRSFQDEQKEPKLIEFPKGGTLKDARERISRGNVRGHSPVFREHLTPSMLQEMRASMIEFADSRRKQRPES